MEQEIEQQRLRLLHILFIGPLMLYAGGKRKISPLVDLALMGVGSGVILINGKNYLTAREQIQASEASLYTRETNSIVAGVRG